MRMENSAEKNDEKDLQRIIPRELLKRRGGGEPCRRSWKVKLRRRKYLGSTFDISHREKGAVLKKEMDRISSSFYHRSREGVEQLVLNRV